MNRGLRKPAVGCSGEKPARKNIQVFISIPKNLILAMTGTKAVR
jgi:hypothetical protein